jgi:hypothetical protein
MDIPTAAYQQPAVGIQAAPDRMKIIKPLLIAALASLLVLSGLVGLLLFDHKIRQPLEVLIIEPENLVLSQIDQQPVQLRNEQRVYHNVVLQDENLGIIRFTISLPKERTDKKLPVIFVLGGLEIGRESLGYIKDQGQNAYVSYEYPYSPEYWYEGMTLIEIAAIRKAVMLVPSQMLAVMNWVLSQEWADTTRYSLLGYSFGAIFVPTVQRYAQINSLDIPTTVIAYGGTDIYRLLMSNIKITPLWLRSVLGYLAARAIWPMEPDLHLPHLEGRFLILNGLYDTQIPESSWRELQRITPSEKKIINLEADHMRPSRPELTDRLVRISRRWLLEQGAINP